MQDNKSKRIVVARLTAVRAVGVKTIIEVYTDATFSQFFTWFTQEGNRRSTKKHIRTANRNESLPYINAHTRTPGLEVIKDRLESMKQFASVKVRIIKRRAYKKLLSAAPNTLGKGLPKVHTDLSRRTQRVFAPRTRKAIPVGPWLQSVKEKQQQVSR